MHTANRARRILPLLIVLLAPPVRADFKLTSEDRVILFGDTAVSEIRTVEWFDQFVRTRYPDRTPMVTNLGAPRSSAAAGNERLEREVFPLAPTEVVLCFGIDGPAKQAHDPALLDAHISELTRLIEALRSRGIRVTLLTPPPPDVGQNRGLQRINYDETVGLYAEAIHALGKKVDAPVIDWYAAVKQHMQNFSSKQRPGWTRHGLIPSWYSLAILADLLLEHWGAEPFDYLITADWTSDEASATIGSARVAERKEDVLVLELEDVPVVVNMLAGQDMTPADWPLSRWFRYRLKIDNLPGRSYILSVEGKNAKPFLGAQLLAGADVSMVGPLANHATTLALHDAIVRKGNQFTRFRLAAERTAPEPELVEGYQLLREAEASLALAAQRIAFRLPARFNCTLRIETATAAADAAVEKPVDEKPVRGRPRPAAPKRTPQGGK
jgi:hypothetical protein